MIMSYMKLREMTSRIIRSKVKVTNKTSINRVIVNMEYVYPCKIANKKNTIF